MGDRTQRDLSVPEVAQFPVADESEVVGVERVATKDHGLDQRGHAEEVALGHLAEAVEELGQVLALAAGLEHERVPERDGAACMDVVERDSRNP